MEQMKEIPLSDLHPCEATPFRVTDGGEMERLAESIRESGILTPLTVRPRQAGGYEVLAGHRRLYAAGLAGMDTVPAVVRELDDDAAIVLLVDSNLHRETLLPSERAFAYRMKLEAMKRQGRRTDLTSSQDGTKLRSDQVLAEETSQSRNQIQRYIRLTYLLPPLREMVDGKQIALNPAVEVSFLSEEEQGAFLEAMDYTQAAPSLSQAQRIRQLKKLGNCTYDAMCEILSEEKKPAGEKVVIREDVLRQYFPKSYTPRQMYQEIIALLEARAEAAKRRRTQK